MNRLFTTSLAILILLTGATGIASVAHAQPYYDAFGNSYTTQAAATAADTASNATAQTALNASNAAAQAAAKETSTGYKAGDSDSVFSTIMVKIMSLFAWLVGVAVLTLDYAVYYTVFQMGKYIQDLTAIGVAWSILRDVGNIMLIFGFLAIGISVILNTERLGYGTKMLPMLLVAAVFLNFSLFFSQAIIDVGNLFASQFYTQINGGTPPTAASLSGSSIVNAGNTGISAKIMSQLGLQAIYGNAIDPNKAKELLKAESPWYVGFLGILLFIVTAFVLFSLAFILIARFVILIYLIILAPIGFAGLAIPQLAGRAKQWWSSLFQQTITAPVLLLLLYVALAVITDAKFLPGLGVDGSGNSNAATGFINGSNIPGFASYVLSFLVAMGLLIAVTIAAKGLSAFGAGAAMKGAGALSFGATAWAGRTTLGWGSQRLSERFKKSRLSRAPIIGRAISGTLDRGAKASFDVRGATIAGGLKAAGIDAGSAQKGGYRDWEKAKIKNREEYAKTLEQTKGEKEMQASEERRKKMMENTVEDIEKQNKAEMKMLRAQHAADRVKTRDEKAQEVAELQEVHNDLLNVQKEEVKVRQGKIDELARAPKEGYAKSLEWGPGQFFNRNKKAAESIRKEAKKSKTDKDLDSLKDVLKKAGEEGKKPDAGH